MAHADLGLESPNARLLVGEIAGGRTLRSSWLEGTGVSLAAHAAVLGMLIYGATHATQVVQTASSMSNTLRFVFVDRPGASGGRSGGEPDAVTPPRRAEIALSTPREIRAVANPVDTTPKPEIPSLVATTDAMQTLPGALTTVEGLGRGAGQNTGGGGGQGPTMGVGKGPSVGDDIYDGGNGVTSPRLIREVKPRYTVDAMRAQLQGVVAMEAVVLPDGSVDPNRIRITRSLDVALGLDQQAVLALKAWRFSPGTLNGRPVAVRINVELFFNLR